ncbi:hypothetical protein [Allonocardiopsis opalescens]|uniref:Uncharacterized protein n=1 Tax=Allonocardiopsis opalescens TaxID=1144618 RepID=A0A2T0Q7E6_9ACTN|nr:hypothetical protein [Allonocardiopsis opalescens]PRX99769.1 hypothetical protein CLV72_103375 [Allonocardiopsis opalescens]
MVPLGAPVAPVLDPSGPRSFHEGSEGAAVRLGVDPDGERGAAALRAQVGAGPAVPRPRRHRGARAEGDAGDGAVVERVWADIDRVAGVIVEVDGRALVVDTGHDRPRRRVVIPERAAGRIQVRHPWLRPGQLFDAVGLARAGVFQALRPATSQMPYRVGAAERTVGRETDVIVGSVTWWNPGEGADAYGLAYPALDPSADCGPGCERAEVCPPLPLLSTGSVLRVRNECAGREAPVAVTACGAMASRFCDRCLACDTSVRGRIAELTLLSFVALGGDPETGCFNATITVE